MSDEVVETRFGKFLINPQDCVGTTLKAGTLWDGPGFLQPIAREYGWLGEWGVTILDIGANIGSYSVWLARQGAWRVVAVEPVEAIRNYLKANLDLNQDVCGDVVIPLGVAGYSHETRMAWTAYNPDNMGGTALVPDPNGPIAAVPLDRYQYLWRGGLSLIKIDAQGCDGAVLRGLPTTLRKYHPTVVFEWEADLAAVHGHTLEYTIAWLETFGYDVHLWPEYANNYLAVPK